MSFRTYFLSLDQEGRQAYADRTDSAVGYLTQVAYGNKEIELGLADALVAVADGGVSLADLPLTARAQRQRAIRTGAEIERPALDVTKAAP